MVDCGEKWGICMFIGEAQHSLDSKGRLILPAKFRDDLGSSFIITRGIDKCLFVYTNAEWEKITQKLQSLSFTKKDARNFMRFFLSGATVAGFDKQGRVNITSGLISYAGLKKDCTVIGVGNRLEIWDSESWNNFYKENEDKLSEIAEDLFDNLEGGFYAH